MKFIPGINTIFCGDNLDWLKTIPDESVDLCYIDPPFFSNANYEVVWGNGFELRSFGDRFSGGISHYIEWMRPRIVEIHRVLRKTGSLFLHCDWHANHRLRCLLDDIFDEKNFRNEIVWHYGQRTAENENFFSRKHDNILFYSKSKESKLSKSTVYWDKKDFLNHRHDVMVDNDGREYILTDGGKGKERYKRYVDDVLASGKPLDTVWQIPILNSSAKERLGYPTQKPEALISRIIDCASKEGQVVLDCFGGGGTTAKVCAQNNRIFLTGDVSPVAVKIMAQRIENECPEAFFNIKGLYKTELEFKEIDGHTFADLVCEVTGWKPSDKKSGDKGIDAWDGRGNPVQIKNHKSSAGGPDVRNFFGSIQGSKKKFGQFVAWDFSRDAKEFVANLKNDKAGIEIQLVSCREVFGPLLITDIKRAEIEKHYQERFPKAWEGKVTKVSKDQSLKSKVAKTKETAKAKKKKDS